MPKSDPIRLASERMTPHIVELWRALVPLKSVVSFMNTGAHPDDEHSEMLAALAFRDGIDISYACSTRGEGGQNNIGRETGAALGALRTAEMERACDILNMRMHWLSESPEDPITDFGFSKSGVDTLARWGRARTILRFVDILRTERPDIICPTFLDVPGQHGHHRAMTEAAYAAFELAADPNYKQSFLAPWQVKKLCLPAWSGAGDAYDDEAPPPPAHFVVDGTGVEPVSGWSYARIGQQSRACHATQGMGRWVPAGEERSFPLHLAKSYGSADADSLTSGLALVLTDLAVPEISDQLAEAQGEMDLAIASFPETGAILTHATAALRAVRVAIGACPADRRDEILHKLIRKEEQLAVVVRLAARVDVTGMVDRDQISFGQSADLTIERRQGGAETLTVTPEVRPGWLATETSLEVTEQARPTNPYPVRYYPSDPPRPCLKVEVEALGETTQSFVPLHVTPTAVPSYIGDLSPKADVLNLGQEARKLQVKVTNLPPHIEKVGFDIPSGWTQARTSDGIELNAPQDVAPGLYSFDLLGDGLPLQSITRISQDHVTPRVICAPARLEVRVMDVALPTARVGYIGAGNDRVDYWLNRLGVDVTSLSDADLHDEGRLADFDCIVVGIFAMKMRPGLLELMPKLHRWTRQGGNLLTLYHRPWDNWDPQTVPPKRLEIGQPSLRWRVTDENAAVTLLAPDHPVLQGPNAIGPEDWANWHKERGLYFAKAWDVSYQPLLAMADAGEAPLSGALLVAEIGEGRHIHTSLILHHQMEHLVPGGFRILANLIAKPGQP